MSTVLIIVIAFVAVLLGLIVFNYYRMKNAKPGKTSSKIRILGNKNFKPMIKRGVTLVDFWAPWCQPCKIVAPVLNEIAETQDEFMVGKVNVDQFQSLAKKHKVRNIPTMVIFKDGVEAGRIVGVKTKRTILKEVNEVLAV